VKLNETESTTEKNSCRLGLKIVKNSIGVLIVCCMVIEIGIILLNYRPNHCSYLCHFAFSFELPLLREAPGLGSLLDFLLRHQLVHLIPGRMLSYYVNMQENEKWFTRGTRPCWSKPQKVTLAGPSRLRMVLHTCRIQVVNTNDKYYSGEQVQLLEHLKVNFNLNIND